VENPQHHEPDDGREQRRARREHGGDDDVRRGLGDRPVRVKGYLAAYLFTLAVEPPLYALALRGHGYREGLLANATSHPLTWLVLFPLLDGPLPPFAALVVVEAFAVAWEAALLRLRLGRDLPLLAALSLVCNAVSLGAGALVLR
jgi:hypothetical protein